MLNLQYPIWFNIDGLQKVNCSTKYITWILTQSHRIYLDVDFCWCVKFSEVSKVLCHKSLSTSYDVPAKEEKSKMSNWQISTPFFSLSSLKPLLGSFKNVSFILTDKCRLCSCRGWGRDKVGPLTQSFSACFYFNVSRQINSLGKMLLFLVSFCNFLLNL